MQTAVAPGCFTLRTKSIMAFLIAWGLLLHSPVTNGSILKNPPKWSLFSDPGTSFFLKQGRCRQEIASKNDCGDSEELHPPSGPVGLFDYGARMQGLLYDH